MGDNFSGKSYDFNSVSCWNNMENNDYIWSACVFSLVIFMTILMCERECLCECVWLIYFWVTVLAMIFPYLIRKERS